MKKLNKIAYEVTYNPSLIEKTGNLMSRMDLGITGVEYPQAVVMKWTTTTMIDKAYKDKIKKGLKEVIEADGSRLISIKEVPYGKD